jgi:hypothetical protein
MAVHVVALCQLQWLYTLELQGRFTVRDEFERVLKDSGASGWQPCHLHVPIVLKSGNLNLLEPSGPVKACNGIALPKNSALQPCYRPLLTGRIDHGDHRSYYKSRFRTMLLSSYRIASSVSSRQKRRACFGNGTRTRLSSKLQLWIDLKFPPVPMKVYRQGKSTFTYSSTVCER